jgi:hypothetical protein
MAGIVFVSIITIISYVGVLAFTRATKDLEDLTFISGELADISMMKHIEQGYFKTTVDEVLVLRIQGFDEKFGFLKSDDAFNKLLGFNTSHKTIAIYYDADGQKIEDNVTLHIYDLTIGQGKIISLEDKKRPEKILAFCCFGSALFLIAMIAIGLKQSNEKNKGLRSMRQSKTTISEI